MQSTEMTTPLKPTRASFVRSLPETMPVAEVIERGREAGLEIKPADIHAARYYMRQTASAQGAGKPGLAPHLVAEAAARGASSSKNATGMYVVSGRSAEASEREQLASEAPRERAGKRTRRAASAVGGTLDDQLRTIVLRIGTERAREIIEQLEQIKLR
jgi:hypothetical protein